MDEKDTAQQPAMSAQDTQAPQAEPGSGAATAPLQPEQSHIAPPAQGADAQPTQAQATQPVQQDPAQPVQAPGAQPTPQSAAQPTATMPMPPAAASGQVPPPPAQPPQGQPVYGAPSPEAPITPPGQAQPSPTGALVCGILAIVFCFIPIVGIVLGIVAIILAGKYFKAGGTLGQGKAGRICGIIGIILSVIMIIVNTVAIVLALSIADDYDLDVSSTRTPAITSSSSASSSASSELDDAEFAVQDAVGARLDKIKAHDPAALAEIQAEMETTFAQALTDSFDEEMTMESCGIDPANMVDLMLQGFDYEPSYMLVDGVEEGDEAEANFYLTIRDMYDIVDLINEKLKGNIDALVKMSPAERQAEVGSIVTRATLEIEPSPDNLLDVDLVYTNGEWVIDEESWQDEINFFFGYL